MKMPTHMHFGELRVSSFTAAHLNIKALTGEISMYRVPFVQRSRYQNNTKMEKGFERKHSDHS